MSNSTIGLDQRHSSSQPQTLRLQEHLFSISGDSFMIKTTDGTDVCMCQGHAVSLSSRIEFMDPQGNLIFTLRKETFAIPASFYAEDSTGQTVMTVEGKFSLLKSKSVCKFVNASDGKEVELELTGDWIDRKAEITLNDTPIAHITRDILGGQSLFLGRHSYLVEVQPGVDLILIAAICVSLDERNRRK